MHVRCTARRLRWTVLILASMATVPPAMAASSPGEWQVIVEGGRTGPNRSAYDRGYREGLREGERDGRGRREPDMRRHAIYRNADAGYSSACGKRAGYQRAFRGGFADGYRLGFDRASHRGVVVGTRPGARGVPGAATRGYRDGFEHGIADGRDRGRYDPVRHGDYRGADNGYEPRYGLRDSYRDQYRTGFRQGYEDGYRSGVRRR